MRTKTLEERFWPNVLKTDTCWLWIAATDNGGYGKITHDYNTVKAHRASWILNVGPIPDGLMVLHNCDIRHCVNPAHLYLGTHDDNMRDMVARKRGIGKQAGMRGSNSILTNSEVLLIRAMLDDGHKNYELAAAFGISRPTVTYIKNRVTWRHI